MKKQAIAISTVALWLLVSGCSEEQAPPSEVKLEDVAEKNIQGVWQGKSAPHLHKGGFAFEVDGLYWRADQEGLEYAVKGDQIKKVDGKWDPGFKVGIGYVFGGHDFWDLFLRWTWFESHQHGNTSGSVSPWWAPTLVGSTASGASAKWKLLYNVIDLELGRDYFISKALTCRPLLGIRGAMIHQHFTIDYQTAVRSNVKAKNDFDGIGVRAGAQLGWFFVKDWAFIGSLTGSLLASHTNVKSEESGAMSQSLKQGVTRVAANLEASLGLQWETFFSCNKKYHVALGLMYEFSEWFSQNQMARPELISGSTHFDKTNGDLGLQGATLQLRFDF